jgi:hypothetical protein
MGIMTSNTAQTETTPQAKPPEKFRSHLPAIIAATTGTVLAATLGSLIGTAGTIAGMVIGSMASGTASWWAERGIRRSAELAATRAEALRAKGHHSHAGETATRADATQAAEATRADATRTSAPWDTATRTSAALGAGATVGADAGNGGNDTGNGGTDTAVTQASPGRSGAHGRPRPRRRWVLPATFIAIAFVACAIVITLIEVSAGKPFSAVVQNKTGHGTTWSGSVSTSATVSPSPTPSVSGTGGTSAPATGTASTGTSSPSPSGFGSSTSPSPTTSPSVSVSPSVTPTTTTTGH